MAKSCGADRAKWAPAPGKVASPDYNYVIGPLDTLHIIVWRNPDLSLSVPVRPDGKVSVPLVEDLPVLGKDSTQLARDIEKAMGKFIREPIVTVIVTAFNGPYTEQIRVVGEAARPQALPYRQKMTLLDVMIAVGGLTDFADGNNASLLRTVGRQAVFRPAEGPDPAWRCSSGCFFSPAYSECLQDLGRLGEKAFSCSQYPSSATCPHYPEQW